MWFLRTQKKGTLDASPSASWENRTFQELLEYWLEKVHRPNVRVSTFDHDNAIVHNHILPVLGGVKMKHLGVERLDDFYGFLASKGVNRPLELAHVFIRSALQWAVEKKHLAENPAMLVESPPKAVLREHQTWTPDEAGRFLLAAMNDHYFLLYLLAIYTGLRLGELLGLEWNAIYCDQLAIEVRHQLCERKSVHTIGPTKSKRGKRFVALPPYVVQMFTEAWAHVEQNPPPPFLLASVDEKGHIVGKPNERNLIFRARDGGLVRRSNFERRDFFPLMKKAKVPKIRFHDLRHTQAALMTLLEVNSEVLAKRLGHDVKVLLTNYGHSDLSQQALAANKFEAMIRMGVEREQRRTRTDADRPNKNC